MNRKSDSAFSSKVIDRLILAMLVIVIAAIVYDFGKDAGVAAVVEQVDTPLVCERGARGSVVCVEAGG